MSLHNNYYTAYPHHNPTQLQHMNSYIAPEAHVNFQDASTVHHQQLNTPVYYNGASIVDPQLTHAHLPYTNSVHSSIPIHHTNSIHSESRYARLNHSPVRQVTTTVRDEFSPLGSTVRNIKTLYDGQQEREVTGTGRLV
jgi:hypothetical protein